MRFRTTFLATAAALTLTTLPVASQEMGPPRHGQGHGGGNPILHMMKELDLSDAQMTQVKVITAKYDDSVFGSSMEKSRAARGTLQQTIHDVNATETQVREAAAAVALLEAQAAVEHHRMAIEISAVLTPDQKAKLADMFAHMEERHAGPPGGKDSF